MKVVEIALEDEGEQIVARLSPVPLREFGEIVDLFGQALAGRWPDALRPLYAAWAPFVVSWSFPDDPTAETLEGQDATIVLAAIRAWITGVRRAPLPLLVTSSGIAPSREASTNRRPSRKRSSSRP